MANSFQIFCYFPDSIEGLPDAPDALECFMENVRLQIDLATCEREAALYYDPVGFGDFKAYCELKAEEWGVGRYEVQNYLNLLYNCITEKGEELERGNKGSCDYQVIETAHIAVGDEDLKKFLLAALIQHFRKPQTLPLVVDVCSTTRFHRPLPGWQDCHCTDEDYPKLAHLRWISGGLKALHNGLMAHRPPRLLNTADPRHNEKSKRSIPSKSPLLYDFRHPSQIKQANRLLQEALTDPHSGTAASKDLIGYDQEKACFIWFEHENAANQYHAYHLVVQRTHERDLEAEERIPERVKQLLKALGMEPK
jgi:hypothetical protein